MSSPRIEIRLADPEGFIKLFSAIFLYFRDRSAYNKTSREYEVKRKEYPGENKSGFMISRKYNYLHLFLDSKGDVKIGGEGTKAKGTKIGVATFLKGGQELHIRSDVLFHAEDEIREIASHLKEKIFLNKENP